VQDMQIENRIENKALAHNPNVRGDVPDAGISAAFGCNCAGQVFITFSDMLYANADHVFVDTDEQSVFVSVKNSKYFVGYVSEEMVAKLSSHDEVLLTSIKADGQSFENRVTIKRN